MNITRLQVELEAAMPRLPKLQPELILQDDTMPGESSFCVNIYHAIYHLHDRVSKMCDVGDMEMEHSDHLLHPD